MIKWSLIFEVIIFLTLIQSSILYSRRISNNYKNISFKGIDIQIKILSEKIKYDLFRDFIHTNSPITADAFKYFFETNISELLHNYPRIKPNSTPIEYHSITPIHSNGFSKKTADYRDFIDQKNINIKHFSEYIKHGDKNEFDKRPFIIESLNGPTKITSERRTQFTLIYAISCFRAHALLMREISALSNDEVGFILFYDYKSNRTELYDKFSKELNNDKFENVYIVDSPRFPVQWGTITQALPELVMMQAALKFFPESLYVSFHSESDYPIVPNDVIVSYLKRNYPKNFIQTIPPSRESWKAQRKHTFDFFYNNPQNREIITMIRKLFPNKIIPVAKWRSGWNWFTITLKDSKSMMDIAFKRFEIVDTLDYVINCDEVIFDTFVAEANISSTFKYLRYIDWRKHEYHPLVFTEKYFSDIVNKKCLFWARKFDNVKSIKVLDMVDKHIKNYSQEMKDSIIKYC